MTSFKSLGLDENILRAVTDLGFETPSEVQEKTIPVLLQRETDIVSLAQTGTGKTAAFGFPMIQKINVDSRVTQGIILSPTRELCLQIARDMTAYGAYYPGLNVVAVYGGASITEQAKQVKRGAQIIVATPGRMKDMIGRGIVDISKIEYCVLDEADEMLNMGFYEDISEILSHTPKDKSTWLFSATMPKEVSEIARRFMHAPVEITIGSRNTGADSVSHEYYMVHARDRYQALKRLADANPDIFSVIFCRTKRDTQKVAEQLIEDGYNAAALHGDLSQHQRDLVMKSFRAHQIQMLVATDVAARGIDVDNITHVINYQLPDEIETYTHRSGRTGRAGKSGVSMVIITKSEIRKIKAIERIIQQQFEAKELPSGMEICEIQLLHLANSIKNTEINKEINPYLPTIHEVLEGFSKEELIQKMFSVEFGRFLNYYKNASDLNVSSGSPSGSENTTRFFINIGARDGFTWMNLKDFLRDLLQLGQEEVYKVDVKNNFSFFNTDDRHKDLVLQAFDNFMFEGRKINVEISQDSGRRRGERRRGGGRRESGRSQRPKSRSRNQKKDPFYSHLISEKTESGRGKRDTSPRGTGGKRRRRN